MNWAELSYELGRVVLVRDFIGPSGLVRVVFGPSCPAPPCYLRADVSRVETSLFFNQTELPLLPKKVRKERKTFFWEKEIVFGDYKHLLFLCIAVINKMIIREHFLPKIGSKVLLHNGLI